VTTRPGERVKVEYTPEFRRNLGGLARKYRSIRSNVEPVIADLGNGALPGDQVPGVGRRVYKVRIQNTDIHRGKRSGYRMVYWAPTPARVVLVTIYCKADPSDISRAQIRRVIGQTENAVA